MPSGLTSHLVFPPNSFSPVHLGTYIDGKSFTIIASVTPVDIY